MLQTHLMQHTCPGLVGRYVLMTGFQIAGWRTVVAISECTVNMCCLTYIRNYISKSGRAKVKIIDTFSRFEAPLP